MITAHSIPAAAVDPSTGTAPPAAIEAQAWRVDQLSAAIVRATAQVTWSGQAAEHFRVRAAERARECLQLAVALRAAAERVHAAAAHAAAVAAAPAVSGPSGAPGARMYSAAAPTATLEHSR